MKPYLVGVLVFVLCGTLLFMTNGSADCSMEYVKQTDNGWETVQLEQLHHGDIISASPYRGYTFVVVGEPYKINGKTAVDLECRTAPDTSGKAK